MMKTILVAILITALPMAIQADKAVDECYGLAVDLSFKQAYKYCKDAAVQGNADAQNNLGVMYAKGEGVIQNHKEAFIWFSIAVANGYKQSEQLRDDAASQLTSSELEEARQEVARRFELFSN